MRARLLAAIALNLALTSGCRGHVNATADAPNPYSPAVQLDAVRPCPPLFIEPSSLGFHVGVGVPYDIVFAYDNFYLYYVKAWYRAPSCRGPWTALPHDGLPPIIRNQRIEDIRKHRDAEYRIYRRDQTHYRGRSFRPTDNIGGQPEQHR